MCFCLLFCVSTLGMKRTFLGYATGAPRRGSHEEGGLSPAQAAPQPGPADHRQRTQAAPASQAVWQEMLDSPVSSNRAKVGKERGSRETNLNIKNRLISKRTEASLKRAKSELMT